MRIALGILMVLHGIAHLPGFLVLWRLASPEGVPYSTRILGGRLDLGHGGIRVVGALWLVLAGAFVVTAISAFMARPGWINTAYTIAAISIVVSLAQLPAARIGVVVNVVIVLALVAGRRFGWLAG